MEAMLIKPNGGLVALKAHTLPFSTSIATEGRKSSLENQKALEAARGAGSYHPHNLGTSRGVPPSCGTHSLFSVAWVRFSGKPVSVSASCSVWGGGCGQA